MRRGDQAKARGRNCGKVNRGNQWETAVLGRLQHSPSWGPASHLVPEMGGGPTLPRTPALLLDGGRGAIPDRPFLCLPFPSCLQNNPYAKVAYLGWHILLPFRCHVETNNGKEVAGTIAIATIYSLLLNLAFIDLSYRSEQSTDRACYTAC